jgi:putative PIN family toxin of toxin-antitoxin system
MRVVLDTNILVRAAGPRGGPATDLFERLSDEHVLIVSPELLDELGRVMSYDRVRQIHLLSDAEIRAFVESIAAGGSVVSLPAPIPRVVPHDPDDDAVVATAVAGQAQVLCTRNRHLFHHSVVAYCVERGAKVMDDMELLNRLREEEQGLASE